MRRAFGHDDFQRGSNVPFAKMPGFGAAVAGADDNMNMQGGLALRIIGDVATLSVKLSKPLSARLLPIAGAKAGDQTTFDDPNLVNTVIQALP